MYKTTINKNNLHHLGLEDFSPFHPEFKKRVKDVETSVLYGATLICQSRINKQKIFETLRSFSAWEEVERVIDIGCGSGEVAKNLVAASLLENKFYTGMDKESSFIQAAIAKKLPSNIEFLCSDVFSYHEAKFDGALLIATLQHLGSLDVAIPQLLQWVKRKGYLFCFDCIPGPQATLDPEVPLVGEMIRQISHDNTFGKRNDQCLYELKEKAPKFGLHVLEMSSLDIIVPLQYREDYFRFNFLASELVRRFYSADIDQEQFFQQLSFWFENEGSAVIHGVGRLLLQRD